MRGRLTRPWESEPSTPRAATDEVSKKLYSHAEDADRQVVERVGQIAEARGLPRAQVALAWVLSKPVVTSPIVGATRPHHLEDAIGPAIRLSPDEILRSKSRTFRTPSPASSSPIVGPTPCAQRRRGPSPLHGSRRHDWTNRCD